MKLLFFILVGSILLLSAEKRTERLNNHGLSFGLYSGMRAGTDRWTDGQVDATKHDYLPIAWSIKKVVLCDT